MKKRLSICAILISILILGCRFSENAKTPQASCDGMTLSEAQSIASKSICTTKGKITNEFSCNEYTSTWWLGFKPHKENKLCNPACVVSAKTKKSEINWRCTGLTERGK